MQGGLLNRKLREPALCCQPCQQSCPRSAWEYTSIRQEHGARRVGCSGPGDSGVHAPERVPVAYSHHSPAASILECADSPEGHLGDTAPPHSPLKTTGIRPLGRSRRPRAFERNRPHLKLSLQTFQPIGSHRELEFSAEDPIPQALSVEGHLQGDLWAHK